ncbi:Rrf2 family transcriptional regulator [Rurimicrobium arvi]|uniref:Rrf2 family transcriptional regulator n=1 Tax=Rurimicrobium arvi TaxID=2049916 RepID=A0ABP8MGP2_9BACT
MFSRTCEHAIRAVIYVSCQSAKGKRCGIAEISVAVDAPESFTAKILQDLVKKGLMGSAKGPKGGFYLTQEMSECSMADVVRAIDGEHLFEGCALGLRQCSEKRPCPLHHEFKKIRSEIRTMLEHSRLGAFSDNLTNKIAFLKR